MPADRLATRELSKLLFGNRLRLEVAVAIANEASGSVYGRALAELLNVSDTQVLGELRRLQQAGLLRRSPSDSGDRRVLYQRVPSPFWQLANDLVRDHTASGGFAIGPEPAATADSDQLGRTWTAVQARLRASVTDSTYTLWLEPLRPHALTDTELVLTAPSEIRGWVADRFARVLAEAAKAATGKSVGVRLITEHDSGLTQSDPASSRKPTGQVPTKSWAFDAFIVGDSNRLAHAAALAVAGLPGQAYNPLLITGGPGCGKTHLLHAIAAYLREYSPSVAVHMLSAHALVDEAGRQWTASTAHAWRETDVLLLDDCDLVSNADRTVIADAVGELLDAERQVVVTARRLPYESGALRTALRDRLESGLVADIGPPTRSMRLALLRRCARKIDPTLDDRVLQAIAESVTGSMCTVESELMRIVALGAIKGTALSPEEVRRETGRLWQSRRAAPLTPQHVRRAAAEFFAVREEDLLSSAREVRVGWPRQVAIYLSRELTDVPLAAIGEQFGWRSHATILNACRRVADRVAVDPEAREALSELTRRLTAQTWGGRSDAADADSKPWAALRPREMRPARARRASRRGP